MVRSKGNEITSLSFNKIYMFAYDRDELKSDKRIILCSVDFVLIP